MFPISDRRPDISSMALLKLSLKTLLASFISSSILLRVCWIFTPVSVITFPSLGSRGFSNLAVNSLSHNSPLSNFCQKYWRNSPSGIPFFLIISFSSPVSSSVSFSSLMIFLLSSFLINLSQKDNPLGIPLPSIFLPKKLSSKWITLNLFHSLIIFFA